MFNLKIKITKPWTQADTRARMDLFSIADATGLRRIEASAHVMDRKGSVIRTYEIDATGEDKLSRQALGLAQMIRRGYDVRLTMNTGETRDFEFSELRLISLETMRESLESALISLF